ncbi:Protein xmas-2 [Papilio xuthus]|uniref:Protein xmas-2 n=1 Tax=Papilio xuthus TaxID=66420 RepID=A0A194PWV2_PAPXU|nr:Protein xmas-2 [Papilio xuthus]
MESNSVKKKSNVFDNINTKTSITCTNVPDGLFDTPSAKKHFSKFGRVQKIKLLPKKQMCIVEYEQISGAEQAVLNAGAFDGFMFDVTRTKTRIGRHKKDEDPEWLPDPELEKELSAMRGGPTYRVPRQKAMEIDPVVRNVKIPSPRSSKMSFRKTIQIARPKIKPPPPLYRAPPSSIETPAVITAATTTLSTSEAAGELHQLRSRVSQSADEQWRTLDARDRILRSWGGAGSRVKVGGATIGTCPDMCPEKELLHRQAEHQVMTLETVADSDGQLEAWRAVKQYSRSSADQEIPMCYELRPAHVLARTCAYLLNEIADTDRQVTLADWFHFMWDRFRGIRKDITQQALCCAESIRLVEMCARFHAHCAARLADLAHTQFDQKLNTDNLTKCLQTLKHMYADVGPELKPREAEFRGYIALLNLGDSNFWWEIKQLPEKIQKSESITFAIQVFTALDNNNYIRFFRLVKEKANYLQACILLRYFNDVRARALARIVKAYAPRGGSKFPAEDIMKALAFESVDSMRSFIDHYGLRFSKNDTELTIILDRNQFIEDSDPYPLSRAANLIETKRNSSVGEVIAGGPVPKHDYRNHVLYSSFNKDGTLKETALIAEDLGYNTINDTNKDIKLLKAEIRKLNSDGRNISDAQDSAKIVKENRKNIVDISRPKTIPKTIPPVRNETAKRIFSFQPALLVAPADVIKVFKINDTKNIFSFSKPQLVTESKIKISKSQEITENKSIFTFSKPPEITATKNVYTFSKPQVVSDSKINKENTSLKTYVFKKPIIVEYSKNLDLSSGDGNKLNGGFNSSDSFKGKSSLLNKSISTDIQNTDGKLSPGSLFKKAHTEADKIFDSGKASKDVYEFEEEDDPIKTFSEEKTKAAEKKMEEERKREEEEKRKIEEERKNAELKKKKVEEDKKAELKQKAEMEKAFATVEKNSQALVDELIEVLTKETVQNLIEEELQSLKDVIVNSEKVIEELLKDLCKEICTSEVNAELFWAKKLMKKWFYVWKKQCVKNIKRRSFLEDTPVWLTNFTPAEEARNLNRVMKISPLKNMKIYGFKRYKVTEPDEMSSLKPYNILEIIRSTLLKRMKEINYPYDKCFFWKVTLVVPGSDRWLYRRVNVESWLLEVLGDKNKKNNSDGLINVSKQTWNNLMDFAISVGLVNKKLLSKHREAIEGTNGFLFYAEEKEVDLLNAIDETIKCIYSYQSVPIAVVVPTWDEVAINNIKEQLDMLINKNVISSFKIFLVQKVKLYESLDLCTKSALKWLAKNCPKSPPIEIDHLKSICQRYLGNEIWQRLRCETDSRMGIVKQDLNKLVNCYNVAVDKLTDVITNMDIFNYPSFPLEFDQYLDHSSPYPKPYEFISSSVKQNENVLAIKAFMKKLKLVQSVTEFKPVNAINMEQQIQSYCSQVECLENPQKVAYKVIATLPNEFYNTQTPSAEFKKIFQKYSIIDFLNIVVYEKINSLHNFDNLCAIYEKASLEEYRNVHWLYDIFSGMMKHKAVDYDEDIDHFIKAKRRKIDVNEIENSMLEDKDYEKFETSLDAANASITSLKNYKDEVDNLEKQLEDEKKKSNVLDNMLQMALFNT